MGTLVWGGVAYYACEEVVEFYAMLKKVDEFTLSIMVKGTPIVIDAAQLGQVLGIPMSGFDSYEVYPSVVDSLKDKFT